MISVVVPCYNAKRVMSKCLDSLLNQSFHDLEIILVNDGLNGRMRNLLCSQDSLGKAKR